jgi:hypothetical protein
METNLILNFGNQGMDRPACHTCGQPSLADVHRIYPHPLRGPSYESVLLSCTQCGTKRLHTQPVQSALNAAGT